MLNITDIQKIHNAGYTKVKSKSFLAAILAAVFMLLTTIGNAASVLEMSSNLTKDSVEGHFHLNWANEIKKRTNGEVDINIRWVDELGGTVEVYHMFKGGEIQLAAIPPFMFDEEFPFHNLPDLVPMGISDASQLNELMERLLVEVPEFDKESARNGVKALFFSYGNPFKLVCKEQIKKIADLNGKSVRASGRLIRVFEAVDAIPVFAPAHETYQLLSSGHVDCVPLPVDLMARWKVYDVAKHVHDITIWQGTKTSVWISRDVWDKLTSEQREVIQELSFVAGRLELDQLNVNSEIAIEELKEHGVQFHDFPAEEAEKWKKANPNFLEMFVQRMTKLGRGESARNTVKIWREVITH